MSVNSATLDDRLSRHALGFFRRRRTWTCVVVRSLRAGGVNRAVVWWYTCRLRHRAAPKGIRIEPHSATACPGFFRRRRTRTDVVIRSLRAGGVNRAVVWWYTCRLRHRGPPKGSDELNSYGRPVVQCVWLCSTSRTAN